ncbi:MAG TPA: HNH endonuclease signature motif containing protein [Actinopolymorphaceae bacterium]|jgi:hypothetical protein
MDQVGNGGSGTAVTRLAGLPGRDLQAALAQIDEHALCGSELALLLRAQARLLAWVQASMASTTNEFVHCPPSSTAPTARVECVQEFACDELALILHVAPMTGKNLVLNAVDLVERHPRLWAALSNGLIDTRKVAAITTMTPDTDDALAAAVDDVLLSTARRADRSTALEQTIAETPGVLKLRTQRVLSALDPSWVRAIRRETLARRRLAKGTYGAGIGVGFLGLYDIDVPAMAAAYEHVNAIARGIKRLGDDRTLDQLRADTAVDLLTGGNPSPVFQAKPPMRKPSTSHPADRGPDAAEQDRSDEDPATDADAEVGADPEVSTEPVVQTPRARADVDLVVHINMLADLVDALRRGVLVEVGGFGLVPADVAARLVKAAAARPSSWCLTAVDDQGRVIEHVRTQHDPTTAMRDFVNARDRHCRFPGCVITAVRCDTDHTHPWETGGATCPCNMAPLCRRHHRLKQAQGWHLDIDRDTNTARWTTPHTGHTTSPPWTSRLHDDAAPF